MIHFWSFCPICLAYFFVLSDGNPTFVDLQVALHKYLDSKLINPLIVPQKSYSTALPINFQFYVNQLIEADAAKSVFSLDGLIVVSYQDFQQEWNINLFPHVHEIERDPKSCWYPTIILLGGLSLTKFGPTGNLKVRHNPPYQYFTVNYEINHLFVISCHFQVFKFPFDEHICNFRFQLNSISSQTAYFFHSNESNNGLSDHFQNHVEWEINKIISIVENHTEKETGVVMCAYQTTIYISRRSASYMISILLPAIGLMIVSIVIFLLPPESGEKIGLSITVLLSYTVFNLTLYTALPKSKKICLVGWLMAYLELLSVVAIFLSGLVLRCYYRPKTEPLEKWAKNVIVSRDFFVGICSHRTINCKKFEKNFKRITTWQEFAVFLDVIFIYLYVIIYTVMIIVSTYFFIY